MSDDRRSSQEGMTQDQAIPAVSWVYYRGRILRTSGVLWGVYRGSEAKQQKFGRLISGLW